MDLTREGKSGAEMVGDGFHSGARVRVKPPRGKRENQEAWSPPFGEARTEKSAASSDSFAEVRVYHVSGCNTRTGRSRRTEYKTCNRSFLRFAFRRFLRRGKRVDASLIDIAIEKRVSPGKILCVRIP